MKIIKQITLVADEGKVLTNGETFGDTAVLPENTDINKWNEITEEEALKLQTEGGVTDG